MSACRNRTFRTALALCALAGAAGCYTTVPLISEPPSADQEIVLEFTDPGAQRLGGLLGRAVVAARGRLLEWNADTVTLAMTVTATAAGSEQIWQGERVAIPREAVARVRKRELDRKRTAIAFVGAVAVVVAVQGVSGSNSGAPPNHGPIAPPGR